MNAPPAMESGVGAEPFDAFLAGLASASPAPGGGAAAALAAGLAAALAGMVCRVTVERDPSAAGLASVAATADGLSQRAVRLAGDDIEAYRGVVEARRAAGDALRLALARATEVPLELARGSREVLALCETLAPRARPGTLGDLRVALTLGWAALEAAAFTAKVNLKELTDARLARVLRKELDDLMAQGRTLCHRASSIIAERMGPLD